MLLFTVLSLVCLILFRFKTVTSSHWIVAENGKIQAQLDSVYHMRSPHDLIAFLDQEKKVDKLEEYYNEMLEKATKVNQKKLILDGTADIGSKLFSTGENCLNTFESLNGEDLHLPYFDDGKDLVDFELLELNQNKIPHGFKSTPDCTKFSSLKFSMTAFPHLQVLANPWNLEDNAIVEKVNSDIFSLPNIGQILNYELSQNRSSWFHYNLAAIYWRKKGKPNKAMECAKRAVHFSSRHHKDISLLNLGSLLRYNEYLIEAAIVLHAALDHAPQKPLIHFTLANVYLFLGDYNRSIACYDNVLHLRSDWKTAQLLREFVSCNWKYQRNLKMLRDGLHDILHHSYEYQELQIKWLKLQEELLNRVVPFEFKLIKPHQDSMASFLTNKSLLNKNCGYNKKDGKLVLKCDYLSHRLSQKHEKQLETKLGLQVLANNALTQILKINEKLLQFSVLPPRFNAKAASHQFKSLDELQLTVKSLKNLNENKNFDTSDSLKSIDDIADVSYVSLDNDEENDDGKLELLLDENESLKSSPEVFESISENVESSEKDEFPSQKYDKSFSKPDPVNSEDVRNKETFPEPDKSASDENLQNVQKSSVESSQLFSNNSPVDDSNNDENSKSSQPKEEINDLMYSVQADVKKSLNMDKYSLKLDEESIMYYNYFSNIILSDEELSDENNLLSKSLDWSKGSKILGRELEMIFASLKSQQDFLSDKMPNLFEKISSKSKCSSNSCQNTKEPKPLNRDWNTESSSEETELQNFANIEVFLDLLSWTDISPDLMSPLKTSFDVADGPISNEGISKCQPSEYIVPDLTASTLTKGKSLSPEPKLLNVLQVIFNDENISTNKIKQYVDRILKDSADVWSAATIAALFWRYSGNADNTVACLQLAVSTSPTEAKHSPLQIFSYILLSIGHQNEALFLASLAIQISPHSLLSHLTLYKIFSSNGDKKKAKIFKSSSQALLASYNPKFVSR